VEKLIKIEKENIIREKIKMPYLLRNVLGNKYGE